MKFKDNGISSIGDWFKKAPPKMGAFHWKDGRSAKELARYFTKNYPTLPLEIENVLIPFADNTATFDWFAEYVTPFDLYGFGSGEGRNHDAIIFGNGIFVGVEGKSYEPFGQLVKEWLANATFNKLARINRMKEMLWENVPKNIDNLRYQLISASCGTLLEAKTRGYKRAILMIIELRNPNLYKNSLIQNASDLDLFITSFDREKEGNLTKLNTPFSTENGIDFYITKISIDL